jgi:hypothetical protein
MKLQFFTGCLKRGKNKFHSFHRAQTALKKNALKCGSSAFVEQYYWQFDNDF